MTPHNAYLFVEGGALIIRYVEINNVGSVDVNSRSETFGEVNRNGGAIHNHAGEDPRPRPHPRNPVC